MPKGVTSYESSLLVISKEAARLVALAVTPVQDARPAHDGQRAGAICASRAGCRTHEAPLAQRVRNSRACASCISHENGDVFLGDALLHPGRHLLHQPQRHGGADVFAHLRDLLTEHWPRRRPRTSMARKIWLPFTRAYLTTRRARHSALTRGRACCPHAARSTVRASARAPLRGSRRGYGCDVDIAHERRWRRRDLPLSFSSLDAPRPGGTRLAARPAGWNPPAEVEQRARRTES